MKTDKPDEVRIILHLPKKIHTRVAGHARKLGVSLSKYFTCLLEKNDDEFYEFFKNNMVVVLTRTNNLDDSLFTTKKEEIKITRELKENTK